MSFDLSEQGPKERRIADEQHSLTSEPPQAHPPDCDPQHDDEDETRQGQRQQLAEDQMVDRNHSEPGPAEEDADHERVKESGYLVKRTVGDPLCVEPIEPVCAKQQEPHRNHR